MAHNNLGIALLQRGRANEAMAEYREALRIRSDDVTAHLNLGNVLQQRGQLDQAVAHYQAALKNPARRCGGPQQPWRRTAPKRAG